MKKLIVYIFITFCYIQMNAQDLPSFAPVSPTAASLGKFGTFPVNTNLGTTNISIPLYTITQGDIEIPISLSYNATSGIRVNEEASWVGLGWTLNAGGAIVRNVKGQPSSEEIPDLGDLAFTYENHQYMLNVAKGHADSSQDEYLFNFSGISGKFYYDQNRSEYIFSDYKPIKIISTTQALLQNGIQLDFGAHESVNKWQEHQLPVRYRQYTTASYLSQVTSSNQVDQVTFEYDSHEFEKPKEISSDQIIVNSGSPIPAGAPNAIWSTAYTSFEKTLKRINFKNGYVLFDYTLDRIDSDSPKLNYIKIYQTINEVSSLIKQITFNYDYYTRSGGKVYPITGYEPEKYRKSLKLEQVNIYSNTNKPQIYRFEYNNTPLTIRNSTGQDFWGYANNNTGSYIHKRDTHLYYQPNNQGTWFWEGITNSYVSEVGTGDRNGKEDKMKAGILTRMYYPTGGYTDFEYEANKYQSVVTIPEYQSFTRRITSEGTGGFGSCDTGLKQLTFSPENEAHNAKLIVQFTDALDGNGNQSYGEFNGLKYFRNPPTDIYPATTHNVDITLNHNSSYTIEAMEYGDGAPGASGCPFVQVTVSWDELTGTTTETVDNFVGGLRIKSITNYDGVNELPTTKKEFDYGNPKVLVPINHGDYQTLRWNPGMINKITSFPGYALNINGGPSVEYETVTEYNYDHQRKDNGKIVYEYEPTPSDKIVGTLPGEVSLFKMFMHPNYLGANCAGLQIPHEEPQIMYTLRTSGFGNFSNYYTKSWASGSLKKQEFYKRNDDDTYTKLRVVENTYEQVDETQLHVNYVHDVIPWTNQNSANDYDNPCSFNNLFFMYNKGFYSFGRKLLTSTRETTYDVNGENPIVTENTFAYDNPHYFRTSTVARNSSGKELITKVYYPSEVGVLSGLTTTERNAIERLQENDLHQIATPIQTETDQKEGTTVTKLNTQRTIFKDWGNNLVLPSFVKTLKGVESGSNPLQNRIQYLDYDNLGNAIEVSQANGMPISYIWGYNQQYPVAKIENATRSEIEALSGFGANFHTGTTGLSTDQETTLRAGLPNAMITTYTYEPLVGVTSITDPREYTMTYHYDEFNRLEFIKDAEGNLVSENKYHYKN